MPILDELKARFDKLKDPNPDLHGPAKWVDDRVSPDLKSQGFRPSVGFQKAADLGEAALNAAEYISTVATGGLYGLAAPEAREQAAQGVAGAFNGNIDLVEADRRAREITDNPIEQAHLRNEFYAKDHGVETGILNMALSPDNLVTGAGRAVGLIPKAAQQAGVARAGARQTVGKTVGLIDTLKDYGSAVKATGTAVKLAHKEGKGAQQVAESGVGIARQKPTQVTLPTGEVIKKGGYFGPSDPKIDAARTAWEQAEYLAPGSKAEKDAKRKLFATQKKSGWQKVDDGLLQSLAATPGAESDEYIEQAARRAFKPRDIYNTWMTSMVVTPRQLLQDAAQLAVWGKDKGLSGREMARAWTSIIDEAKVKSGKIPLSMALQEALPNRLASLADRYGWSIDSDALMKEFGSGFLEANTKVKEQLAPWQTAAVEFALPNMSGTVSNVPLLGNVIGGISGYYRAYQNSAFGAFNHFQHTAARSVAFEDGFSSALAKQSDEFLEKVRNVDPALAGRLEQAGKNYFQRRVLTDGVEMTGYKPESLFTPSDVRAALGGADGAIVKEWAQRVENAKAEGGKRAKEVFADFSNARSDNRSLIVPYLSYPLRAYPRTFEMMLDHPTGALITYHLIEASQREAEEKGLPTYAAGGFTIDQDTKVLGFMARILNGGREGTTTVQPLGLLTPIPADAPDIREADKPFDKVDKSIGAVLPSFSPLVKIPAYLTGFSDQTPGNFSRLQGPASLMPGPEAPTFRQYLEAERKVIGESAPYDPIAQIAKELVFTRTQAPLEDPRNVKHALDIHKKEGIYAEAEDIYNKQLTARNAVGFFNPTNTVNVTEVAAERNKAQKTLISPAEKAALAAIDPKYAVVVDRINDERAKGTAARVNANPDIPKELKKDPRLVAWERDKKNVAMRQSFPAKYKTERAQFIRSNRIEE